MDRQRADMARVNAMLAETSEAHAELVSETFGLRAAVENQTKVGIIVTLGILCMRHVSRMWE